MVVLRTLGAPQRRLLSRRSPQRIDDAEPAAVPTARATLIGAEPFASRETAEEWLAALRANRDAVEAEVAERGRTLNALLRAHRAAAADPYARDVSPDQALVARVGFGEGEQVADGRFTAAYELPRAPGRRRRAPALQPQERLAAILSARERVLACEELVLRARADLDAGRAREAALQARIALETLLTEISGGSADDAARGELEADRDVIARAANSALRGNPSEDERDGVAAAVARMETALRRHGARDLT